MNSKKLVLKTILSIFIVSQLGWTESRSSENYIEDGLFPQSLKERATFGPKNEIKVNFVLPPYSNPGNIGIQKGIVKLIKKAKISIRGAFFQFNDPVIVDALRKAINRGVNVTISTEACYRNKEGYKALFDILVKAFEGQGLDPNTHIVDDGTPQCSGALMHNKYIIFDFENPNKSTAWMGTYNLTAHSAFQNTNITMSFRNHRMAQILKLDHDQLMQGLSKHSKNGVYQVGDEVFSLTETEILKLVEKKVKIGIPTVTIGRGKNKIQLEVIIGPKVKGIRRVIEEIYKSKSQVAFSTFAIADPMVLSALINKSNIEGLIKGTNREPIFLQKYAWEKSGYVFRLNGNEDNTRVLWDSANQTDPSVGAQKAMAPLVKKLKQVVSNTTPYLLGGKRIRSSYKFFYPHASAGGRFNKVRVEGIFSSMNVGGSGPFTRLHNANIPIYRSTINGNLHNKMIIIDKKIILFGSHNFSQNAENLNDEVMVILKSKKIAEFVHSEYYTKTKLFTAPTEVPLSYKKATLKITEVMAESAHKKTLGRKRLDIGEYVELYNFGTKPVNVYGMRLSDHYYPTVNNEKVVLGSNIGYSTELIGYVPPKNGDILGKQVYNSKSTIIRPKGFALVVGRLFKEKFYRNNFKKNFRSINGREPRSNEYPILLTTGSYRSVTVGDSRGLSAKDKLTLYGLDRYSVIDRYDYPVDLKIETVNTDLSPIYSNKSFHGYSVQRTKLVKSKKPNDHHVPVYYLLKPSNGGVIEQGPFEHQFFGSPVPYGIPKHWVIDLGHHMGTPGTLYVPSGERRISLEERFRRFPFL